MTLGADFPQHLGVVNYSTGAQQVLAIRLAVSECPEERRIDNLSQAFIMDIIRSQMDKDAGLYIAVRSNVKKVAGASLLASERNLPKFLSDILPAMGKSCLNICLVTNSFTAIISPFSSHN